MNTWDLIRELVVLLAGFTIKHVIGLARWIKIRGAALAILDSADGTNDPKIATEQATLLIEQPKIQHEAIAVARTRSASLPPPIAPNPPPTGG